MFVPATSFCAGKPELHRAGLRCARAVNLSSDEPWPVPGRRLVCSQLGGPHCASAHERWSMASDPDLQRFAESNAPGYEASQPTSGLPAKAGRILFPVQHLNLVLHFV